MFKIINKTNTAKDKAIMTALIHNGDLDILKMKVDHV